MSVAISGDKMPARFNTPFPEFYDENGNPREGYKLFFYANGTQTKLNTYSDVDLSVANANPMALDEYGRVPETVFLQNQYYTVVLAEPDASDPPSGAQIVWQDDYVSASDFKSFTIRKVYNGNPNGHVAGTAGSSGVLPTECWDYANSVLYVCTTTGNAATAVWTAINIAPANAIVAPQGRLTGVSATPVMTADLSAAGTIYYTPHEGNIVPIYGGASYSGYEFSEASIALNSTYQAANGIYDVFAFDHDADGSVTFGFGPSWASGSGGSVGAGSSARGTGAGGAALSRVGGFLLNAVSMTINNGATTYSVGANRATYLGTIMVDGTAAKVSCRVGYGQLRKWGIWNAFNQRPTVLELGDGTASWTYNTNTIRVSNNDATNNKMTLLLGLADQSIDIVFGQNIQHSTGADHRPAIGVGYNSTTATSGLYASAYTGGAGGQVIAVEARRHVRPIIGVHSVYPLENGGSTGGTFYGGEDDMLLVARFLS